MLSDHSERILGEIYSNAYLCMLNGLAILNIKMNKFTKGPFSEAEKAFYYDTCDKCATKMET